ncbi:sulfatase [Adhaeribacter aerolatus]|uniref:Sulfatase n=2 Tax=Adhaeribacter aerolatus TaxID=670289 RepID=A0A512B5L3_9BACT|nr:sulfatase [Adhaeribacter aerolatus]
MGWTDVGCFGSDFYKTPNIDKLARQGMKFTNGYAACTVCSPSRASILTGKYPARLHLTDWIEGHYKPYAKLLPPAWTQYLPLAEVTVAEILKKQGYATASIGKWHLGDDVKYYPEHQGFDLNIAGTYQGQPPQYFSPYNIPRLKNGPAGEFLTERLTDEALKFIKDKKEVPFFLYMPFFAVHTPLQAREADIQAFKAKINPLANHQNPVYAAMVKSVDESVGRIMALLAEQKLSENTFVIFTSDNGGLVRGQNFQKNRITSNAPLRAGKGSNYEGGIRVPTIAVWPGKIRASSVSAVPVIGTDLFPTFAEVAGVHSKSTGLIDGQSLLPLLTGKGTFNRMALYWHYPHYHTEGATPHSAIRQGDWKLIHFYETGKKELYNLKNDIGEETELQENEPQLTAQLYTKLENWRKKVGAQDPILNPDYDHNREKQGGARAPRVVQDPFAINN